MKKTMLILIILASLIPGILAVTQYIESEKKDKESKLKEYKAEKNELELNKKIDSLSQTNSKLLEQVNNLSQDNFNLSYQLTETALKLNNNVIGNGDIEIEINNSLTEFRFQFHNKSNLPVNNANIVVQDYNEIIKCAKIRENENEIHITLDCYKDNAINYTGFNFNPFGSIIGNKFYSFKSGFMNFAIHIETRKKTIIYHLVYKIIKGEIEKSYKKYNLIEGRKILVSENNSLKLNEDYWGKNFYTKKIFTH